MDIRTGRVMLLATCFNCDQRLASRVFEKESVFLESSEKACDSKREMHGSFRLLLFSVGASMWVISNSDFPATAELVGVTIPITASFWRCSSKPDLSGSVKVNTKRSVNINQSMPIRNPGPVIPFRCTAPYTGTSNTVSKLSNKMAVAGPNAAPRAVAVPNAAFTAVRCAKGVVSAIYLRLMDRGPPNPVMNLPHNAISMDPYRNAVAYNKFPETRRSPENINGDRKHLFVQIENVIAEMMAAQGIAPMIKPDMASFMPNALA